MRLALLLAVLPVVDDTGEQFYKFPKDSVWNYIGHMDEDKTKLEKVTITVTGEADGKVTADMNVKGEAAKASSMLWYVADGVFFWAEKKGDKIVDAIGLYKVGSKKGDTWSLAGNGKSRPEQSAKHLGTEEVKVPAGVYKDAVHVRVEIGEGGQKFQIDVFLVEKVGVVKMVYTAGEREMPLELESFKPAK